MKFGYEQRMGHTVKRLGQVHKDQSSDLTPIQLRSDVLSKFQEYRLATVTPETEG